MNSPCAAAVTSLYPELEAAAELSPFISMIPFVPSFFVSGFRGNAICIGFWKYTYLIYLPTRLLLSISHKPLPKPPSSLKAARRLIDYNKLHEKNPWYWQVQMKRAPVISFRSAYFLESAQWTNI